MQREGCRERERENRLERSIKQIAVRSIKKVEQVGCVCVCVSLGGTRRNKTKQEKSQVNAKQQKQF